MFEKRGKPLISKAKFAGRMATWLFFTLSLMLLSLVFGVIGYHYFANLTLIDSLHNASMILGGMGEIDKISTDSGKIFSSLYAIYCGIFLVICGGLLLVPIFHRILHHFHADKS